LTVFGETNSCFAIAGKERCVGSIRRTRSSAAVSVRPSPAEPVAASSCEHASVTQARRVGDSGLLRTRRAASAISDLAPATSLRPSDARASETRVSASYHGTKSTSLSTSLAAVRRSRSASATGPPCERVRADTA
jgi:hypothetical protein